MIKEVAHGIFQNLQMSPIPPNQFLNWDFFLAYYNKPALVFSMINYAYVNKIKSKYDKDIICTVFHIFLTRNTGL